MIQALIEGEGDPGALAELAKGKLRPKIPELTAALSGHFGAHHALVADRVLAHLDFLDDTIAQLSRQIAERVAEATSRSWTCCCRSPGCSTPASRSSSPRQART